MSLREPPKGQAADDGLSPVLKSAQSRKPKVKAPDRPFGFYAGVVGIALIGVFVFSSLSKDRLARAQVATRPAPPMTAAPTVPPPALAPAAAAPTEPAPPVAATPEANAGDLAARLHAPAMIVDIGPPDGAPLAAPAAGQSTPSKPSAGQDAKMSAEDRFSERVSQSTADTVLASRLSDTALIAPQGTVVPAILETAINSDLPGFVRAVVSRDVRGFDGSTVLIPRGAKLIGQYKSGVANGQSRAFVVWSRLITPTGVSVDIGSPGADRLGRGGLEGETNTHFFQRFGSSIMLSVLSAGLDALSSNKSGGNTAIVIGSPQQATNVASIALQKQIDIPDTISVPQGAPIRVFIARDLDFSSVMRRAP